MKEQLTKYLLILILVFSVMGHVYIAEGSLARDSQNTFSDINMDDKVKQGANTAKNITENTDTADNDQQSTNVGAQAAESTASTENTNKNLNVNENKDEKDNNLIQKLLESRRDLFGTVLDNIDRHQVQILYTQVNRDQNQKPSFKSYYYRVDPKKYFYPGSSIKLSACVLALEKLNNLGIRGLDKDTYLEIGADYPGQTKTSGNIANYIKRILINSDNYSFNRLYEFLGQKYYNETLWSKGYNNVKIVHRLAQSLSSEANRHTNPFTFYKDNKVIYQQPSAYNKENYSEKLNQEGFIKGIGVNIVNFSESNSISIENLQAILKAIIFKWETPTSQRFNLTNDDYNFLQRYLSATPRQAGYNFPASTRIYRKSGYAWGYMINNAYIIDVQNNVEFLLTAVIHDGNFDYYNDYSRVNRPFLSNLGKVIYEYEKNTKIK